MLPTLRRVPDGPGEDAGAFDCEDGIDDIGNIIVKSSAACADATFDKNGIQKGGRVLNKQSTVGSGWSNQFALPYEISFYLKFNITGPAHRPTGCPGINNLTIQEFPYNQGEFSVQSPAGNCDKNEYAPPEGVPIYQIQIMEEFEADNEVWAKSFFDGWQTLQSNG